MEQQHPLNSVMGTTMDKIKEMVDVNTVVGDPITTPDGTVIIPVSKVSFGFASGGTDFSGKNASTNFGGGSGAGVTVSPVGFLVADGNGVRLIPVSTANQPLDRIASMVPDIFDRVTGFVSKTKDKKKAKKEAAAAKADADTAAAEAETAVKDAETAEKKSGE